ncbi:hypothetical protein RB6916 [Rhodopirellula baltica SH 1]|uniref:Uncharacterized protein n=1 Tax=Rhodopirellula baltica (strain DSM 10527 / NCIMB 13988 / SH1) TaxID=243090 RepID=Q7UPI4_RHOBA|nr:hypothetical protein RB6916 [Rhodopirellula baltica SH 1]
MTASRRDAATWSSPMTPAHVLSVRETDVRGPNFRGSRGRNPCLTGPLGKGCKAHLRAFTRTSIQVEA